MRIHRIWDCTVSTDTVYKHLWVLNNRLRVIYCFRELLSDCPEYNVPRIIPELSTRRVLTSELIEGTPLDRCASLDQGARNHVRA